MQGNILFDNIYIGHSIEDADALKKETWDIKHGVELKEQEAQKPAEADPITGQIPAGSFTQDPINYVKAKVNLFIALAKQDPVAAIKTVPEVAGGLGVILVTLLAVILGGGAAGAQSPAVQDAAKKAKDQAVDAKDKAAEAVSTGAEKAQAEVNKRTTRSSGGASE